MFRLIIVMLALSLCASCRNSVDADCGTEAVMDPRIESPDAWYEEGQVLHWIQFKADTVRSIWMMDPGFAQEN